MLEHAHRNDAVETVLQMTIVEQLVLYPAGHSALLRPLVGKFVLLLRKRDACDFRSANFRKIKAKSAPARTDIENLHARPYLQLRGKVPFLGKLRIFQRLLAIFEISARILPVAIEKEIVDRP